MAVPGRGAALSLVLNTPNGMLWIVQSQSAGTGTKEASRGAMPLPSSVRARLAGDAGDDDMQRAG